MRDVAIMTLQNKNPYEVCPEKFMLAWGKTVSSGSTFYILCQLFLIAH